MRVITGIIRCAACGRKLYGSEARNGCLYHLSAGVTYEGYDGRPR